MKKLLTLILTLCGLSLSAQYSKLSTNLTARLAQQARHSQQSILLHTHNRVGSHFLQAEAGEGSVFRAILRCSSASSAYADLAALGIESTCITDELLTATLSLADVEQVAGIESIERIELGAPAQPCLKFSRTDTAIDRVHNANPKFNALGQSYTGHGVVVGVVDTGFEYGHAAFRRPDGTLRISRVWEQTTGYGRTPGQFNYGTELRTESEILNARTDNSGATHGTHVAGCAAGSDPSAPDYQGMAPNAELVLVAVSSSTNSSYVMDAVKYIFDYASEVGKPCVINLSLGSHFGPHDGTSTLDQAFDALTGPGRILVGAAGNEGDYKLHLTGTFTAAEPELRTMYGFLSETAMDNLIDIWGEPRQSYSVSLIVADNLKGQVRYESEALTSSATEPQHLELNNATHGVTGYIDLVPCPVNSNERQNIYIETHLTAKQPNRTLGLILRGPEGTTIHAWNCSLSDFVSNSRQGFTAGDTHSTVGEIGGTSRSIISVGAYQLRGGFTNVAGEQMMLPNFGLVGDMGYFSSLGPTLDGRMKPDVCAPGVAICGPVSKHYYGSDARYQMEYLSDGTDKGLYYYYPMTGTSMASPIVAGIVACWLEADPSLTPEAVRQILSHTSRRDLYTGPLSLPDNRCGYGKIDAYAGLLEAAHYVDPEGIRLNFNDNVNDNCLYDLQGRRQVRQSQKGLYIHSGRKVIY
ncbi:MAG: S8 family serine peptidase [Bacteroidaceae bacterium]|nr:S8 family serine peptidase [Bacteroidaceae bacterium]